MRKSAVLSGIRITQRLLEERCRAVSVVNIETGRVVAFVKLKDGRAIKQGAIHLESLIPKVGLEPTPPLKGPDFESGTSAILVVLETRCSDDQRARFQGDYDTTSIYACCCRIGLISPVLFPFCSQIGHVGCGVRARD